MGIEPTQDASTAPRKQFWRPRDPASAGVQEGAPTSKLRGRNPCSCAMS